MKVSDPIKRAVPFACVYAYSAASCPPLPPSQEALLPSNSASYLTCIILPPPIKRRQMETSGGYMARAHRQRKKRLRL